jgi:hypothetical protein
MTGIDRPLIRALDPSVRKNGAEKAHASSEYEDDDD